MGGATTEMSEDTTRVLIEAAHWEPTSMFRTGRRHKLTSEAGKRNERGVDPTLPLVAAERVAELLVEHGGGTVDPGVTLVGTPAAPPTITIDADLPARITGMEIAAATTVANLELVGCTVATEGGHVSATVPTWRPDLTDPFDLVEEVARIVGYDKVPSVLPRHRLVAASPRCRSSVVESVRRWPVPATPRPSAIPSWAMPTGTASVCRVTTYAAERCGSRTRSTRRSRNSPPRCFRACSRR